MKNNWWEGNKNSLFELRCQPVENRKSGRGSGNKNYAVIFFIKKSLMYGEETVCV